MLEFSLVRHGKELEIECCNREAGTCHSIFTSPDHLLMKRLYAALLAADKDQIRAIMRGWSGRSDALELRRMEDILNHGNRLYFEPKTNRVMGVIDLYKEYKQKCVPMPYTSYVTSRLSNKTLQDHISLVPEGGRRAYVASFV